ncbi:hypothetical protein EJ02DRAFT_509941 [Clathrospora elynae]|uniref:Uncharacterized protein n=1 Tax=Clathrospora elynae TaxID=706981 RepID=A0A6A5T214_9PLEO|nr:hypothetical protein EJ02DRAFT_509941 [Clathrospora elynae]
MPYPLLLLTLGVCEASVQQSAGNNDLVYSPLRPPSVPLAVRSPYTSTWNTTSNGSTLNSRNFTFWTGSALGWAGVIRVDGTSSEYTGDSPSVSNLRKATPLMLGRSDDLDQPQQPDGGELVFAFPHAFGSSHVEPVLYTVDMTQEPDVNYRTADGDAEPRPWWISYSFLGDINNMIIKHYQDFPAAAEAEARSTAQHREDIASYYAEDQKTESNATGEYSSAEWANGPDQFRQPYIYDGNTAFWHPLPVRLWSPAYPPNHGRQLWKPPFSEINIFGWQNEHNRRHLPIYPVLPFWLYANPELLRMLLVPVFEFQETWLYQEQYSMRDIIRYYPNAAGYAMSVEESANIVIMAYAY